MSLTDYKNKRSFSRTPEPEGKAARSGSSRKALEFVVQKHHASHLHYDFRIELRGTLKSWAVPKGPSMNPADKRLAMLVEDHPYDYKDFEGIIPNGNYGAGTVIIWDRGTYEPAESIPGIAEQEKKLLKDFHSGQLSIKLNGKKLKGEFVLVRAANRGDNAWLLIKKKDSEALSTDITLEDRSVVSGRSLAEVAENKKSKKWISNRPQKPLTAEKSSTSQKTLTRPKPSTPQKLPQQITHSELPDKDYEELSASILDRLENPKQTPMPRDIEPMLATLSNKPFDKPDWIFEVKWDGYRALAYINKGKVNLRSRNNNSFNKKFYPVYEALKLWPIDAVIDGEIVVVNEKGLSVFSQLEGWESAEDGQLEYYVFDILWFNGIDLTSLPLLERREILQQLVPDSDIIRYSESFAVNGIDFFRSAEKLGIEGIVAKKANSPYLPGERSSGWLKIKTQVRHEAIIAGYTRNEGSDKLFSAVILGVYNEKGELEFIGQAGTGFTKKSQADLLERMEPLRTAVCPFPHEPEINRPTRFRPNPPKTEVFWLEPELVCEVSYLELKPEGIMRHASFQGLRSDKPAVLVNSENDISQPAKPAPGKKTAKKSRPAGERKTAIASKPAGKPAIESNPVIENRPAGANRPASKNKKEVIGKTASEHKKAVKKKTAIKDKPAGNPKKSPSKGTTNSRTLKSSRMAAAEREQSVKPPAGEKKRAPVKGQRKK